MISNQKPGIFSRGRRAFCVGRLPQQIRTARTFVGSFAGILAGGTEKAVRRGRNAIEDCAVNSDYAVSDGRDLFKSRVSGLRGT
jgi:hypothetical protein